MGPVLLTLKLVRIGATVPRVGVVSTLSPSRFLSVGVRGEGSASDSGGVVIDRAAKRCEGMIGEGEGGPEVAE